MARDDQIDHGKILQSFLNMAEMILGKKEPIMQKEPVKKIKRCPGCFISLDEIIADGKLNCLKCYSCFGEDILNPIENKPNKKKKKKKITYEECLKYLEHSLKDAIKKENYEAAGLIKDALQEIEKISKKYIFLQEELEAAIKNDKFDRASEIQQEMDKLLKKIVIIQKRFSD